MVLDHVFKFSSVSSSNFQRTCKSGAYLVLRVIQMCRVFLFHMIISLNILRRWLCCCLNIHDRVHDVRQYVTVPEFSRVQYYSRSSEFTRSTLISIWF